jgi:hypothetical protein
MHLPGMGGLKVNLWLAPTHCSQEVLIQIGIRLESDFHWCTGLAVESIAAWRCLWAMIFW